MQLSNLIELLQEQLDDLRAREGENADCEVRIMEQPSWPFENTIRGVVSAAELGSEEDDDPECGYCERDECEECGGAERPKVKDFDGCEADANRVFIVEGSQARYGNKDAFDAYRS